MPTPTRPPYDVAFKRRAVEQVLLHRRTVNAVAKELHCSRQSVKDWIEQFGHAVHPSSANQVFLPLVTDTGLAPLSAAQGFAIVTKSGLTLKFPDSATPDTIVAILRRLEEPSC